MIVCDVCKKMDGEREVPHAVTVFIEDNDKESIIEEFHLCDQCRHKMEGAIRNAIKDVLNPPSFIRR